MKKGNYLLLFFILFLLAACTHNEMKELKKDKAQVNKTLQKKSTITTEKTTPKIIEPVREPVNEDLLIDEVKKLVLAYQNSLVSAINQHDVSLIKQMVEEGSNIENEANNLINNLKQKGISEELTDHSVVSAEKSNNNLYLIKVSATYNINMDNQLQKILDEVDEYTANYSNGHFLLRDVKVISTNTVKAKTETAANPPNNIGSTEENASPEQNSTINKVVVKDEKTKQYEQKIKPYLEAGAAAAQDFLNAKNSDYKNLPDINAFPDKMIGLTQMFQSLELMKTSGEIPAVYEDANSALIYALKDFEKGYEELMALSQTPNLEDYYRQKFIVDFQTYFDNATFWYDNSMEKLISNGYEAK